MGTCLNSGTGDVKGVPHLVAYQVRYIEIGVQSARKSAAGRGCRGRSPYIQKRSRARPELAEGVEWVGERG